MQQPSRMLGASTVHARGAALGWGIVAVVAMITAALVVVFLRHLPPPPRFDDLRIDPGSERIVTRGILRRLWTDASDQPVVTSVDDVRLDDWPRGPDGLPAVRLVYRVPIERGETTFVRFLIDGEGTRVTLRRGLVEVLTAGDSSAFTATSASVVVPDGASDLDIEVVPQGEVSRLRIRWQEVDGDGGGPWPLNALVESNEE